MPAARSEAVWRPAPVAGLLALLLTAALPGQTGDESLFSLPRSQDENYELTRARDDLERARTATGDQARELMQGAVERLHRLVGLQPVGVIPVGVDRYHGLQREVLATLARLSPEAEAFYRSIVRREGGSLLRRPPTELSEAQLLELASRFPAAPEGRRARTVLGDRALEAGRADRAAQHYVAALDATDPRSAQAAGLRQRLQTARVLAHPRQYAGRPQPDVEPEVVSTVLQAVPAGGDQTWPNYNGGGAGTRPMEHPAGRPTSELTLEVPVPGFDDNSFAMHAVGDLGGIYVSNGQRVYALSPLGRNVDWIGDGPMVGENRYNRGGVVNPDMVLAAGLGDDIVVAALQVPDETDNIVFRRGLAIVTPIPERRLFAFDRVTGKQVWAHWDHINGPLDRLYQDEIPCGPPLVHGDTVYVPSHDPRGTIAFYLRAYELATGELRWERLLCSSQQEVNMFGNANMEFAASPLALDGGVLYGSTNLGLCFAADAASGRIRWLSEYEVVPLPTRRGRYPTPRPTYFANNAPVVTDGVMACTPLDSYNALAFDTETGSLLWRLNHRARAAVDNDVRWLIGAVDGEFLFSGLGVVGVKAHNDSRGLDARVRQIKTPPARMRQQSFNIPRGAIAEDLVFHPLVRGLTVFDLQGNPGPDPAAMHDLPPRLGNLLMVDGMLVSVAGDTQVSIAYDSKSLLTRAEARAAADPGDLLAIYRRAALLRAASRDDVEGPQGDLAEQVYREGLQVARRQGLGPGSPLFNRLAQDLFALTLERGASRALREPREALADLRRARDEAPDDDAWLEAQELILRHSRDEPLEYLAELDLMTARFGRALHVFPDVLGPIPVQAYALWLGIQVSEQPAEAVRRCQEILDLFADEQVQLIGQSRQQLLGTVASARLQELLDEHGEEIYAPIEERAAKALAGAGDDSELLHAIASRFPHSRAADRAMGRLMDLAAENGDLGGAADAYAKAMAGGQDSPGLMRRMMVAAERGGNLPLARSLARGLLDRHADEVSDFPLDGGARLGDVVTPPASPDADPIPPQLPAVTVGTIEPPGLGDVLKLVPLATAEGFPEPANPPLYVSVNQERLEAHALSESGAPSPDALFEIDVYFCEQLTLCGETLVVPDMNRVRGVHYLTGAPLWELAAQENRVVESLGIHGGVLHLFSLHRSSADGGELLGVEPLTGSLLFRRVFPPLRRSSPLRFTGGEIVVVESYSASEDAWIHRIDPVTGKTNHRIPILPDLRRAMDLHINVISSAMFVRRLFASEDTVFVPVNSRSASGPPKLAAIDHDGVPRWIWTGGGQRSLLMHARRDDRVVIVEGANSVGSRIVVLDADTGEVMQERDLLGTARVLNWDLGANPVPAPRLLLVTDRDPTLRLTCLSLVDGIRPFQIGMHGEDDLALAPPVILGDGFVAFGVQRDQRLLLYALDLRSKQGAFPGGRPYLTLPPTIRRPYEIKRHGPYTVVQSNEALTILGR